MLKRVKGFTLIELLIVVAIIAILAAIAVPNFLEAQTRAKVSRVESDLRTMATALESYYIDTNSYPAQSSSLHTLWTSTPRMAGINDATTAVDGDLVLNMPVFRRKIDGNDQLYTLTTPIQYITSFFSDPFADTKGAYFNYSRAVGFASGWIMWSYGPDGDEKRAQPADTQGMSGNEFGGNIPCLSLTPPYVETIYYDINARNPTPSLTNNSTYDPSNGTTSVGDVYRIKQ